MFMRTIILLGFLLNFALLHAQISVSSDDLFKAARNAAFKEKNDEMAKQLAKEALLQSPEYADIEIFLGRLYTWNKQYDSAVLHFDHVLTYAPNNEDAGIAYTDLEYWNDHYQKALTVCNNSLTANAASAELLLRKAKIFKALKQYKQASVIVDQLVKSDKRNNDALSLASSLKDAAAVNKIGINFDYSYFDKQYSRPWYLTSISYNRQTMLGSVIGRINYANRFGSNGVQGELDAYPRISKTFYSYINFGYSGSSIFPKYRAGFSLYANLPHSFEAEGGIRYLNFGSDTYIYTLSLSKYYSNFLFGVRTYVTPGSGGASQSYTLSGRYYFADADNYLELRVGTGISPDERILNYQYSNKTRLTSKQASVGFNHSFSRLNIFSLRAGWVNQQYKPSFTGNQFDASIGYQRRF
jgi:YaiO family outer membrane protein